MSSKINTNTTPMMNKAPFCKACFKAGKDKSEYTNHFTKSSAGLKGVIVCPTILAACCNYCGKTGHWANEQFCQEMKKDTKARERKAYVAPIVAASVKISETKGGFAALLMNDDDSDNYEPVVGQKRTRVPKETKPKETKPKETKPKETKPKETKPKETAKSAISWASIASQPAKLAPENFAPIFVFDKMTKTNYFKTVNTPQHTINIAARAEACKILDERKRENIKTSWDWANMDTDSEGEEDAW